MRGHCFNENITTLVADFLSDRFQSVRFSSNHSSSFIPSNVGTPQGTKLGPILWLIYCNDLCIPNFSHVKYADDTSFYTAVSNTNDSSAILPALNVTQRWAEENSMLLNANKTVTYECFFVNPS